MLKNFLFGLVLVSSFSVMAQPKLYIESEKDGRLNAVIMCEKINDRCLNENGDLQSKMEFAKSNGFDSLHEVRQIYMSGAWYFSMIVSKKMWTIVATFVNFFLFIE